MDDLCSLSCIPQRCILFFYSISCFCFSSRSANHSNGNIRLTHVILHRNKSRHVHQNILWSIFDLARWILIEKFNPIYRYDAPAYFKLLFGEMFVECSNRSNECSKMLECHKVWQVHISRSNSFINYCTWFQNQNSHELDSRMEIWFD